MSVSLAAQPVHLSVQQEANSASSNMSLAIVGGSFYPGIVSHLGVHIWNESQCVPVLAWPKLQLPTNTRRVAGLKRFGRVMICTQRQQDTLVTSSCCCRSLRCTSQMTHSTRAHSMMVDF